MTTKTAQNIAIVWGTNSALSGGGNNAMTGAIIETLQVTPKNGSPIDIEEGSGLTAIQVMLKDGFDGKSTHVYDSNRALPAEGANITLVGPKNDGNVGTANYNCTFWSFSFSKNKKKEATVEMTFTYRPLINGDPT